MNREPIYVIGGERFHFGGVHKYMPGCYEKGGVLFAIGQEPEAVFGGMSLELKRQYQIIYFLASKASKNKAAEDLFFKRAEGQFEIEDEFLEFDDEAATKEKMRLDDKGRRKDERDMAQGHHPARKPRLRKHRRRTKKEMFALLRESARAWRRMQEAD